MRATKVVRSLGDRIASSGIAATTLLALSIALTACNQQMNNQPYHKPLRGSDFFADGRVSRPLVDGTIARGHLREDLALYSGKQADGKTDVTTFPVSLTHEVLARGQERFNVYCSPCHGRTGDGDGMIVARGFSRPTSFYDDRLLTAPVGHFYDVMTNGFGRMPDYATQIPVKDRWAIAGYVRALQLSRHAPADQLPPEERKQLAQAAATNPATNAPTHAEFSRELMTGDAFSSSSSASRGNPR